MSSDWPLVGVEDVCELIVDCVNKTAPVVPEVTPYRMIRTTNVRNGRVDISECRYVEKETYEKWTRRAKLEVGDVILTREAPIGEVGFVTEAEGVFLGQRLMQYRADPAKLDSRFLLYSFLSPELQHQFGSHEGSGSVVSHIRVGDCFKFKLKLPPLKVQQHIGSFLRNIDERIALLRETNATLEAIAQALFKSWFVDFDPVHANAGTQAPSLPPEIQALFPATFTDSPQGSIPEGWSYSAISSVVEGLYDGPHATPPEATNGGIFLGIKNLTGTRLDLSDIRYISDQDWDKWTKRITPQQGDIVFSYEATLGFFALVPPKLRCCLGRRLALVRPLPEDGTPHFWFHQFVSFPFQQLLDKHTIQGATVNRIALKSFPSLPVLVPCIEVRKAFESIVGSIWASIHANQANAETLTDLRNTLLPRLISGQLHLPEVEMATKEAC